jgi:hypothetical protein
VNLKLLFTLTMSVALVACSDDTSGTGGSGGGVGEGGSDNEGGAGSEGGGSAGEVLDLFACGLVPDCTQDTGHLGEELTEEDIRCGGALAASDEPGVLLTLNRPGPYPTQIEGLYVLDGRGFVFHQGRSRCGAEGACEGQNTTEWRRSALELCVVDVAPEAIAGCDDEGPCATWTCADLPL